MRTTIYLYTTDSVAVTREAVEDCIRGIDFAPALHLSRTIGPANYYELEKEDIRKGTALTLPPEDVHRQPFTSAAEIGAMFREGSVLSVSYSQSARIGKISEGIAAICNGAFFWSTARFSFGPLQIVKYTEDEEGQDGVELIDEARFCFALTCDNFTLDPQVLRDGLDRVAAFVEMRSDFERIVGPLKLYVAN